MRLDLPNEYWEDGHPPIKCNENDLWFYSSELAATAAPGTKLYTGEEMNKAEYSAYHAGRESLLSPNEHE